MTDKEILTTCNEMIEDACAPQSTNNINIEVVTGEIAHPPVICFNQLNFTQLKLSVLNKNKVKAGQDYFVGFLKDYKWKPQYEATSAGYIGKAAFIGEIFKDGKIVVRACTDVNPGSYTDLSFTYISNDVGGLNA